MKIPVINMDFKNLTRCLNSLTENGKIPSVDCIVYKNHEMIYRQFLGKTDIEKDINIKGDEIYFIFSMTKMITCTAALQLYEKGAYSLDEPVSKYLPEFSKMKVAASFSDSENSLRIASGKHTDYTEAMADWTYAKNQITVMDLFTMSAGLDYNLEADYIKEALAFGKTSSRELVSSFSKAVLGFEPGTRFMYSLCHDVLGVLVEIWSGKSLGDYMEENIFKPLGMKNTFFGVPKDEKRLSKMAARYSIDENGNREKMPLECVFNLSGDYQSGGAGLCSTTEDYALFLDALACGGMGKSGNRILAEDTVRLMAADHLTGERYEDFQKLRPGYGYGLGVRVHKDAEISNSLSPIGEFGWDGAAGAFSMVDAENKLSLTYFQHIHPWELETHYKLRNALYTDLSVK